MKNIINNGKLDLNFKHGYITEDNTIMLSNKKINDERAVKLLISALKDEDSLVRKHLAIALGRTKDPRAVTPLISLLQDNHSGVRRWAAHYLGLLGDERAVEPLITALKDSKSRTRSSAIGYMVYEQSQARLSTIEALGKLKDERAIAILRDTLDDKDSAVNSHAIIALCEIAVANKHMENNSAMEALNYTLNHKNKHIRGKVKFYLKNYYKALLESPVGNNK